MSITHSIGTARTVNCAVVTATLAFSCLAVCCLAAIAMVHPERSVTQAGFIYSLCLFTCSLCSYFYTRREDAASKPLLRQLDHAAIFLLIAGTYTPFAGGNIGAAFGIKLLPLIWGLAIAGIALRLAIRQGYDRLFIGLYVLIGWVFVTALKDVIAVTAVLPLSLLAAGAVVYSLGALVFACDVGKWTDPIWHACVLIAAALHFLAVTSLVTAS